MPGVATECIGLLEADKMAVVNVNTATKPANIYLLLQKNNELLPQPQISSP